MVLKSWLIGGADGEMWKFCGVGGAGILLLT